MRLAAKEETVFPLAAVPSLAENSRLGFALPTAALHPGFGLAISNTATEFDAALYDFRSGPLSSAYFRDAETSLDYAINRYHQPGMGRFLTPDPYMRSARLTSPGSWNRYPYVGGDPVNRIDRKGLKCTPGDVQDGDVFCDGEDDPGNTTQCNAPCTVSNSSGICYDCTPPDSSTPPPSDQLSDDALMFFNLLNNQYNPGGLVDAAGIATLGPILAIAAGEIALTSLATGTTVLGSAASVDGTLASYVTVAGIVGGEALNLPSDVWTALSTAAQQAVMTDWIDAAIANGNQIIFANNPSLAAAGTGLAFEYQYITQQLGLTVTASGTS